MSKPQDTEKDQTPKPAAEEKANLRPRPRYKPSADEDTDEDLFNDMPV